MIAKQAISGLLTIPQLARPQGKTNLPSAIGKHQV